MEPLFIQPLTDIVDLEKLAGEVDLPEDPNQWPQQILQELYKQVPYIADFQPHVTMERVDSERGYGIGQVEIANKTEAQSNTDPNMMQSAGIRSVRIPVVIRERKLSPFDLVINDTGKMVPLTENRLRQALFRPQAFDVTSQTPGDQSMIGQLYPPYRQNYGFGGGGVAMASGMGKQSSALEEFLSDDVVENFKKVAKTLTPGGRDKIKEKNFALPEQRRYPIHDESHARAAISMVAKHGTPGEKAQVAAAVAKKYPGLAARSSVPAVKEHAQKKTSSVMALIAPTLSKGDIDTFFDKLGSDLTLQSAYKRNGDSTLGPLSVLAHVEPVSLEKRATALASKIKPSVVQLVKTASGYKMKTASTTYWAPIEVPVSRRDIVQYFGEKVALAADTAGQVTMSDEAHAPEEAALPATRSEAVDDSGLYKVTDIHTGQELVGFVIPNLMDVDGKLLPIALFTNGSQSAVQPSIKGVPAGEGGALPTGEPRGAGVFFSHDETGKLVATVPLELSGGSYGAPGEPSTHMGMTYDGREVEISQQPNIQTVVQTPEGKVLVPLHWKWSPLGLSQAVALESAEEMLPEGHEGVEGAAKESHVIVRGDHDCFTFEGRAVEKLASDERQMVSLDQAMFLLGALGVDQGYGLKKLAWSMNEPQTVKVARRITLSEEQDAYARERASKLAGAVQHLRKDLMKEAAVIPDPTAVDAVLSLGFINPENVMTFVSYLPTFEDAQSKMCDMLLGARVGLDLPATALERAIRSLEETIEGLKILAFQTR